MLDEFDPKTAWQNQPKENTEMSLDMIRAKAWKFRAATRREWLASTALAGLTIVGAGIGIAWTPVAALRIAMVLLIAWTLAGQYFLSRGMWPEGLPGDSGLKTGVEFYRREMERRNYLFERAVHWSFGPVATGIVLFVASLAIVKNAPLSRMAPFLLLFVIWIGGYFVVRAKRQREFEREMQAELL